MMHSMDLLGSVLDGVEHRRVLYTCTTKRSWRVKA
jgi:hypothetical protein